MDTIAFYVALFFCWLISIIIANSVFYLVYKNFFNKEINFRKTFDNLFFYEFAAAILTFYFSNRILRDWLVLKLIIFTAVLFFIFWKLVVNKDASMTLKKSLLLFFITVLIIFPLVSLFMGRVTLMIPIPESVLSLSENYLSCAMDLLSSGCHSIFFDLLSLAGGFFYSPLDNIRQILITI
ncbi:MAG: hypothetical protein WC520_02045 [Candidatus Paceibacterota bacterium]